MKPNNLTIANIFLLFFILNRIIYGQSGVTYYIPDLAPIPPKTFEFLKYGEIPISEYSGIPEICIPIYTIQVGDLEIPINLTYHAGGIRVKEEASWVGLGWSLNFGSITQIVNDRDDFGDYETILPDYYQFPHPTEFIYRHPWPNTISGLPAGFTPASGEVYPYHSYPIFTDYWFPLNGDYNDRDPYLFNGMGLTGPLNQIDSEPDVFKASFFGHSLEFIQDFETNNLIILNEKKYKILKLLPGNGAIGWKITTPSGNIYYFEEYDETYLDESNYSFYGGGYSIVDDRIENRTWFLTKIETYKNKEIFFNYFKTPELENLPTLSQTWYDKIKTSTYDKHQFNFQYNKYKEVKFYNTSNSNEPWCSHSITFYVKNKTKQTFSYLSSIEFPEGKLVFTTSERLDFEGTKKLDTIKLIHNEELINYYTFQYNYFIGHNLGNSFGTPGVGFFANKTAEEISYRLKLESVKESGKPPYSFTYNSTQLPKKTSYAVDYWGFYNGQTSNYTLVPNPIRFGISNENGHDNNKSANLSYTNAAILERIYYPSGGATTFDYELNTFTNYFVPDFDSLNNVISKGLGLRVHTITNWKEPSSIANTTSYSYKGGVALNPLKFFIENISYARAKQQGNPTSGPSEMWTIYNYTATHAVSNNYYISSLFGSGNFVGYDKVTIRNISNNESNGKRILYFVNKADIPSYYELHLINMPAKKHTSYPHNGLLTKEEIFDKDDNLIRETNNYFHYEVSDIFYGMKTSYSNLLTYIEGLISPIQIYLKEQNIAGYYPIYSGESLLDSTKTINWFGNNSLMKKTEYSYNDINLLHTEQKTNSKSETITKTFLYPKDLIGYEPYMASLYSQNRLNNAIILEEENDEELIYQSKVSYFQDDNGLIMPHIVKDAIGENPLGSKVYFDNYDTKGNLLQFHLPDNFETTYLWGYNYSYPVAKIENATYNVIESNLGCTYEELQQKTNGELYTIFNNLRDDLPDAMITSYIYKPLVGMTSETDPSGTTTYYYYDSFNRLETIKDHFGNIIKHIDYHYKDE